MDILGVAGIPATFFVIGTAIAGREETLRRTESEGHENGNDAFRHRNFEIERVPVPEICHELIETSEAVSAVVGSEPQVFRPPGFGTNEAVRVAAAACGFEFVVNASVWTDDYHLDSAEQTVGNILSHPELTPGAIIDLHDWHSA